MAIFKCKMCGGALEIGENQTVATCEYCGTGQTLPKLDNEKKLALFSRANNLRIKSEFDKAAGIYESIIAEYRDEAEAYWGLVLCKYGIEYVDDGKGNRIPTCHRTLPTAIMEDDDFQQACENADIVAKNIYRDEAKAIDKIQKKILNIALNEEPYDIFICYKETDDVTGSRTEDSSIAQDIYTELIKDGYRVFFSRVSLREVAGTEYEPYIYAALSSAKIMLAIGTKHDYYDAVWVKNEWSRFISMMGDDCSKVLIPCFKNMDAYDMPKEFKNMQALDMGDVTFFGSLTESIERIIDKTRSKAAKETIILNNDSVDVAPLLERGFLILEDKDWNKADELFEAVLNKDPKNAKAYLGKLLVDLKVSRLEDLSSFFASFDSNNNYEKIMRFADNELKESVKKCNDIIVRRNEEAHKKSIYEDALEMMESATTEEMFENAGYMFQEVKDYADAKEKSEECFEKGEIARKDALYDEAMNFVSKYRFIEAIAVFDELCDWKDSKEKSLLCKQWYEELKAKEEADRIEHERKAKEERLERERVEEEKQKQAKARKKRIKKIVFIVLSIVVVGIVFSYLLVDFIIPEVKYSSADKLVENKEYKNAISIYEELVDYKDCANKVTPTRYLLASYQLENKEYQKAYDNFCLIIDYEDSKTKSQESGYACAKALMEDEEYTKAINIFIDIGDYKKSESLKDECYLKGAKQFYKNKEYNRAISWYEKTNDFDENDEFYLASCYNYGVEQCESGNYNLALTYLKTAGDYSDAKEQLKAAKYGYINDNKNNTNTTTFEYLKELKEIGYKDSESIYEELYAWKVDIIANEEMDDYTNDMSSISKYSEWYFHVTLSGGAPQDEVRLKYTGYLPDGSTNSGEWDFEWIDGDNATCWFYYNTPAYGTEGQFNLKVYDNHGNFIGEKSIRITS